MVQNSYHGKRRDDFEKTILEAGLLVATAEVEAVISAS